MVGNFILLQKLQINKCIYVLRRSNSLSYRYREIDMRLSSDRIVLLLEFDNLCIISICLSCRTINLLMSCITELSALLQGYNLISK